ncbi:MAG: response regulator [Deltaproteobacteria bacterium]|jgi:signal transduction histidine kinase/CheY-like chemotaxis protein|nr:response regulator [Deltaproteobacteria bacterium]
MDGKDGEITRLKAENIRLQELLAANELKTQKRRDVQSRLDTQIDMFKRIHHISQRTFQVEDFDSFYAIAAEGIVDVFQLEASAVYMLDLYGESMSLVGNCNIVPSGTNRILTINKLWLANKEHWAFDRQKAIMPDAADPEAPWAAFDAAHVIYMPIFDNERSLKGFFLGMITQAGKQFYDFYPTEILSSFTVYCQQMNSVYNNISSIGQARWAMNAKNLFFANLSHEMRTPLNAIIGMVQVAQRSGEAEQYKKGIEQIGISSQHLLGLISDVLDFSKIEEGKMVLEEKTFDIASLLDNLISQFMPQAKEKNIAMTREKTLEGSYTGDATRLSQVLMNLVSNAVKFTPAGGRVTLTVEETGRQADRAIVRFSVRDTGIGITQDFKARLFKPFEQQEPSISRKYGGTGLGLAISRRIVEMMGGDIKVESTVGEGARFYFSIVLGVAPDKQEDISETDDIQLDFSGSTLLLVDDVEINREIVMALLDGTGIRFDCAENGLDAVEMIRKSAPGHYLLVFMDVQMPVMDGLEAAREIRALDHPDAKTLPIIAMTANAFKEDVNDAVNAGMDGHISKPVQYDAIISAIRHVLERR